MVATDLHMEKNTMEVNCSATDILQNMPQPYHPVAQDWLPTEAKQGWAWSVPGWETSWEN